MRVLVTIRSAPRNSLYFPLLFNSVVRLHRLLDYTIPQPRVYLIMTIHAAELLELNNLMLLDFLIAILLLTSIEM